MNNLQSSKKTEGIYYIAIGEQMRKPLIRSIESVHEHLSLPITIVTNLKGLPKVENTIEVEYNKKPGYAVKPRFIPELPYDRTLYLDTDTVILSSDASKPLRLLTDRYGYEFAAVHGMLRRFSKVSNHTMCTPSFNSGVLFIRKTELVLKALKSYQSFYSSLPFNSSEEPHLTRSMLEYKVPTYCLPCEWNYRGLGLKNYKDIRILHHRTYFKPVKSWFKHHFFEHLKFVLNNS